MINIFFVTTDHHAISHWLDHHTIRGAVYPIQIWDKASVMRLQGTEDPLVVYLHPLPERGIIDKILRILVCRMRGVGH